jgi:hypothetical protein
MNIGDQIRVNNK